MPPKPSRFSVVVPVYNSGRSLEELYQRLVTMFETQLKVPFELIFVDDASRDHAWEVLKSLRAKDSRVKIFQLARNFGQHNAIMCGFHHSQGEYIITLDDDLQNPPEEIPKLVQGILNQPWDVVIGQPLKKEHSLFRNFGSYLISRAYKQIFNKPEDLYMGNFRIIKAALIKQIICNKTPNPVIGPLILRNTSHIANVAVEHAKRVHGNSNYKLSKTLKLTFDLFINYSTIPLKIVARFGFLLCAVSMLWGLVLALDKMFGLVRAPGWTSIMVMLLFFSSINLMVFGFVGEYLARIIMEVSYSPQYLIREQHTGDAGEKN